MLLLGDTRQVGFASEMSVPVERTVEAVDRVLAIAEEARELGGHYHSAPFSIRFVKASRCYLSPQYGRDSCMIEFLMLKGSVGAWNLLRRYEEALLPLDGRPHWGLANWITDASGEVAARYPELSTWRGVKHALDPDGMFDNAFTDRIGASTGA